MQLPAPNQLIAYDRKRGRYVCGADEVGRACWAGPLVTAAVRFDYARLDAAAELRLQDLDDSKKRSPARRAALLPVILELADMATVVVVSPAEIDRAGLHVSNLRALGRALQTIAVAGSVNLVDCYPLETVDISPPPEPVDGGDRTSAAIAAASIIAKETRDELMRGLDVVYPSYGFAAHKGYGTAAHAAAVMEHGFSPVHRQRIDYKALAKLGPPEAA